MTCRELDTFLDSFVAGILPEATALLFQQHLDECPECVAYLAQYRRTMELGRSAYASEAGEAWPESIVRAIVDACHECGSRSP